MMRLIDADALKESLEIWEDYDELFVGNIRKYIDEAPTIEPRKKGKWINRSLNIMYPEWERYTCSVCGKHSNNYDFCPYCGSDNRGEERE
jgi:rubrerythrin